MNKIIEFPAAKTAKTSLKLRQRLKNCRWDELDDEEQLFAAALCSLLGLLSNRWINPDIVARAGLARDELF